ncbi:MAG: HAD family hydrolase [Patescibacteria group bacterium]
MIKLVAFDVNGTLFSDQGAFFEALNSIFDHFKKPRLSLGELRKRFTQPWTKIYRESGITEELASEKKLYEIYNVAYRAQPHPELSPGALHALEWLREQRIPVVIISTQYNELTEPLLKQRGLTDFFEELIGGVHDKSESLLGLAAERGFAPEEIAYIGDQDSDVKFAFKAGCIPVAYTGGVHDRERLASAGAKMFLDNLGELPKVFAKLIT